MIATTHDSTGTSRDPGTAVFEHAAALLASAQALEAATRAPGAETVLGPLLACLDLAFDALAQAPSSLCSPIVEMRVCWRAAPLHRSKAN
jgi:hypothetical protein